MLQPLRAMASSVAPALLVLSACAAAGTPTPVPSQAVGSTGPTASATASPTEAPSDSPAPTQPPASDPVIVTFLEGGAEQYRILLTDPEDIAIARRLLAGEPELARIPVGVVVRDGDGGVNTGWSWHIDPDTFEFAEVTIEVCDGAPSDVEADPITYDRYCPWAAEVIDIEDE